MTARRIAFAAAAATALGLAGWTLARGEMTFIVFVVAAAALGGAAFGAGIVAPPEDFPANDNTPRQSPLPPETSRH